MNYKKEISNIGDLTKLAEILAFAIEEFTGTKQPVVAIAFTLKETDYKEVHWITNISRSEGIRLFREVANKMERFMNEKKSLH